MENDEVLGTETGTEQIAPEVPIAEVPAEPADLSEAFAALKKKNASVVTDPVPATGDGDTQSQQPTTETTVEPVAGDQQQGNIDTASGGSAVDIGSVDYDQAIKNIIDDVNQSAVAAVRQQMAKDGIRKFTVGDLYQRDEQSGTVIFQNPENKNRPFASRMEAQAWVDSFNQDVDNHLKQEAIRTREEYIKQVAPTVRLLQFMPKVDALNPLQLEILDSIIEPYAITDESGDIIGYNCDLNTAYKQMNKTIERLSDLQKTIQKPAPSTTEPTAPVKPASTPALDIHTSGGTTAPKGEPATLEEAIARVQAAKRKGN